MGGKSWTQT